MPRPAESPASRGEGAGKRTQLLRALSKLGLCSRGEAARRIAAGEVRVNGAIARDPEAWVELGRDRIEAPGLGAEKPAAAGAHRYWLMHKPAGCVTTRSDELGRETVYGFLPPEAREGWLFPVGRLDKESEGLLLLTDDGAWSDRLTDPEYHVEKRYRVKLDGRPLEGELESFRQGIVIDGKRTLPAGVEAEGSSWYLVRLREGRNRQIRKMFHALGYKVKRLVRVAIGPLELGDLGPGKARPLEAAEVEALRRVARKSPGRIRS